LIASISWVSRIEITRAEQQTTKLRTLTTDTKQCPGTYTNTQAPPTTTPTIHTASGAHRASTLDEAADFELDALAGDDVPLDGDEAVAIAVMALGVKTPPEGTELRQDAAAEDASCAVFGSVAYTQHCFRRSDG